MVPVSFFIVSYHSRGTENAQSENDGQGELTDWNLMDWKMMGKTVEEFRGLEYDGLDSDGPFKFSYLLITSVFKCYCS